MKNITLIEQNYNETFKERRTQQMIIEISKLLTESKLLKNEEAENFYRASLDRLIGTELK